MNNRPVFDRQTLITPQAVEAAINARTTTHQSEQLADATAELALILHTAHERFKQQENAVNTMRWTVQSLHDLRRKVDQAVWRALIPLAQMHPAAGYFHQDPFTRWSFEKPRGYSGDAQLLDFIYRHETALAEAEKATPTGKALYDYSQYYPSCVAVRERRDILARRVDEIAAERGGEAEILAIACGHLREAEKSTALANGRIKRWVALDQDPMSVGAVMRDFAGTAVDGRDGSVGGLLQNAYTLGQFDFIYAAGLYDYLPDAVAIRLTRRYMSMLKPGGTILFANFAPDITDDGYMETFMDWTLLLRSEADMWKIINGSVDRNMVDASVYFGENRNIVYAEIQTRA
jgi:hypothetical protein